MWFVFNLTEGGDEFQALYIIGAGFVNPNFYLWEKCIFFSGVS